MSKIYTVETGLFSIENGRPKFKEADLRVPLVSTTLIGRAANALEDALCEGGTLIQATTEFVKYTGRPSYNGTKIIMPGSEHLDISREHGRLDLANPRVNPFYTHLSTKERPTTLWMPNDGVVKEVYYPGELIDLLLGADNIADRYLLLGGSKNVSLDAKYIHPSYYVLIRKQEVPNGSVKSQ